MRSALRAGCAALSGVLALCLGGTARGQVVEVSGGSSTLYQSQGATLKMHGTGFESGLSGGVANGQFIAGSYFRRVTRTATYTVGMQDFSFNLPTDLFSGEHRLAVVGAGLKTKAGSARIQGFVGATSARLDSPFVQGFSHLEPAAAFFLTMPASPHLNLSLQTLVSKELTVLGSAEWKARRDLTFASSLGFAGSERYAAVSMDLRRPRQDLAVMYVVAGANFRRTSDPTDQTPEFVRENISYTYRSSTAPHFLFTVQRQNFLIPTPESVTPVAVLPPSTDYPPEAPAAAVTATSGLDEGSAVEQVGAVHLSQSLFHSNYEGQSNLAYAVSASISPTRWVDVQGSYFRSYLLHTAANPVSSLVMTVRERMNSRMSVSETVNYSGGQPTIGFGGSLLSGFGSVSVDYQTVYVATRPEKPFQQSLMLDVGVNVFGRLLLHAGTLVSPTGKLLYTVDAKAAQGISRTAVGSVARSKMGRAVLSARVVDEEGNPVEGAAIEIGGTMAFTDSDGIFFLREKRPALHAFRVVVDEFLDGRAYRVVSQPMQLASSRTVQTSAVIVVALSGSQTMHRP